MSGLVEALFSIGIVVLFPLTVALLYFTVKYKEQCTSDEALGRLKENWSKLMVAAILGSLSLFIFLFTELIELLETLLNLQFDFLSSLVEFLEIGEVVMIYLLIFGVAISFHIAIKLRGDEK